MQAGDHVTNSEAGEQFRQFQLSPRADKQLAGVHLKDVLEKRSLDQALNAKEFAVLAGISYSTARQWFRSPCFPSLGGFVFWTDFVEWRRSTLVTGTPTKCSPSSSTSGETLRLPPRARKVLAEASVIVPMQATLG